MTRPLRGIVAGSLTALLAFGLAACSSDNPEAAPTATPSSTPSATAPETPAAEPGPVSDNLDGLTVEGGFGEAPVVSVPAPFTIDESRVKVLVEGTGTTVQEHGIVEVNYQGINGRTGEVFDDSFQRGEPATFPLDNVVPGFSKGLMNQKVGSRVIMAMPGSDGYDSSGGNPQIDIQVGDTLIFVADIVSTPLDIADGVPVPQPAGLPTVTFENNQPTVALPGTPPPTEVVVQPLLKGTGRAVEATDSITARYQAVTWSDGTVIEDTYATESETGPLTDLIPAWQQGLTGQTVGSRVLIIAPPSSAYPEDPAAATPRPGAGDTIVYVIDLLYTEHSH